MKKIAILTWLHNYNYGSALQAFALNTFLNNNGFEATDIDYRLTTSGKIRNFIKEGNSLGLLKEKVLSLKHQRKENELFLEKKNKFNHFLTGIKVTQEYNSSKELKKIENDYDVFVCGSDQIWSPRLFNPTYYLDFVSNSKKIAYACSFGSINTSQKKNKKITKLLSDFSLITVREREGQSFLEKLNISSTIVMDPVFLLSINEWDEIAKIDIKEQKYCFAYFLSQNDSYFSIVDDYCCQNNMLLILCSDYSYKFKCKSIAKKSLGPVEWLSFLRFSSCVATDSFHGLAFSILYQKPVVCFERFKKGATNNQNSRIYELTNKLDMSNCIYSNITDSLVFSKVSSASLEKMKHLIGQSKQLLLNSINSENE